MIQKICFILMLFITLASCKAVGNDISILTITPASIALSTKTATPTMLLTQTGTPTVSPDVMHYQCLEIAEFLPSDRSLDGVIVYNDDNNLYAYLSNNKTDTPYFFQREDGDRLLEFEVSPDGKYLVYLHHSVRTQTDRVVLVTAQGQLIWSQKNSSLIWGWFDNERLVNVEVSKAGVHTLKLINPFTGLQQTLPADLPDSEAFSPDWFGHWSFARGMPIYDPTLSRAVYPAIEDSKEKWPVAILWDTQANKKVAQIMTVDYWGGTPLWLSDGKQFVIATNMDTAKILDSYQEIFAVSRDGQIRQLTHFMDYYQEIKILGSYSLSPNGKLLAFWITAKPSQFDKPQLAILNIETSEVTNYCIKGDPFADNEVYPAPPVWSPDSTQLLVISRPPEDTKVRRVVVVDIVNNYTAQINQDMEPVGWMTAP
ncbi:MAG TPA: hypothetical protein PK989_10975 [Anaerolineales bacterium]|nr:hypothetical protein [Anaerolineales bacterium]